MSTQSWVEIDEQTLTSIVKNINIYLFLLLLLYLQARELLGSILPTLKHAKMDET